MLIFLSALKQIPHALYESAMVDGAKPAYTFVKIATRIHASAQL